MSGVVAHVVDGVRVVRRRRLVLQDFDSDSDQDLIGHSLTYTRSCCDISLGDQLHWNLLTFLQMTREREEMRLKNVTTDRPKQQRSLDSSLRHSAVEVRSGAAFVCCAVSTFERHAMAFDVRALTQLSRAAMLPSRKEPESC